MGPGFGKGRVDFKNSLAGLGAFQGEQVEGSMDFWCGASGNLRIAGPAADREKPSDANRRWRRSRAWLGGLRGVGGKGKDRSLPGPVSFSTLGRAGVASGYCLLPSDLVLRRRPDAVGPRPCPGGLDGLHPVDVANARPHVGAGVDDRCAVGVRLHIGVTPWR